jgi:glycosyltransferase involved in cell wall biosynthesis
MGKKKLTVLHIFSGDLWGGAEVMVFNLLRRLNEASDIQVLALGLNEGILVEKLRETGVQTHVVPERDSSFWRILWKAYLLLKDREIDVIHAHRYKENVLGFLLSRLLRRGKLVTTLHGWSERTYAKGKRADVYIKVKEWLNFLLLKGFFERVVSVSKEVKETLVRYHGFDEKRIMVIHNGIPSVHGLRPDRDQQNGQIHIGSVGRLVPVKNYELFLEVAARVTKGVGNVRFSLLGNGPERERLIQKAKDLRISDHVTFVEAQRDPSEYYAGLDIYLNTSRHEGIPLSILEAMAHGKPVVAPEVGGIPEIISNGTNGVLVKTDDPEKFAAACLLLASDAEMRRRMGEKAQKRVKEAFIEEVMANCYRELYDAVSAR